jgi:hypothetical protein
MSNDINIGDLLTLGKNFGINIALVDQMLAGKHLVLS